MMWPLVAWLLLFPLADPAADWLAARTGQTPGTPTPSALRANVALYLAVAVLLYLYPFLQ